MHQETPSESDASAAAALYSQMSIEELEAFQTQFLEGMWKRAEKEQMELPSGFDLEKTQGYVAQGLLPVFVPLQKGGWRVSEVRPSVLSKLLNASTEDSNLTKIPFLKNQVSNNFKNVRKRADVNDYQEFVKKYIDKAEELYSAYPHDVPLRQMRVEASPVSESSQGQRILIYGNGPLHMTTYLKYRDRIIGMYEVDQNGSLKGYKKTFKLDDVSVQLADLNLDLTRTTFFDEGSLEYAVLDSKWKYINRSSYREKLDTKLNEEHFSQHFGLLDNWAVLEFLVGFNPDAQFVLVFEHENIKEESQRFKVSEIPFQKGSALGREMVKVIEDFNINFVSKISQQKTKLETHLKDYWMFKYILKELPDLFVVVSANYRNLSEFLVNDKIEQSLVGMYDLTQDGLIVASDLKQYMYIKEKYEAEFFINRLSKRVGVDVFSVIDVVQNLAYTKIPRWILRDKAKVVVPFEFTLSHVGNLGFRLFHGGFLGRNRSVWELQSNQVFSPKGASLVILSYFNWLSQNGAVKTRADAIALFDRQSGLPVFIDVFQKKQYLSGHYDVFLHEY